MNEKMMLISIIGGGGGGGGVSIINYVVGVIVVCCVWLILHHFWPLFVVRNGGVPLPQGSFGWPFLGETRSFLKPHSSSSIGSFLQIHCSRYGKVFKSHLFFSPTIVSCDQELNYYILQNEDKLFQCSYPKPIHGILGKNSMLVVVGDTHKRLRNVAVSLVTTMKSKPGFLNDIESTATHIFHSWKDKNQVLFCDEARKYTFNVIVKQVLGLREDEPQTKEILQDFLTFMKGLISLPIYIPGTPYARAVQARIRISSTVKAIIEERRRRRRNVDEEREKSDFLEILLSVDTLSEDEKVSFVLDSLLGGYETTSLLMSMAVFFLHRSPSALHQLKEISSLMWVSMKGMDPLLWGKTQQGVLCFKRRRIGGDFHLQLEHQKIRSMKRKNEFLNWDDYRLMEFTQNVISEALRFGNIVKFVHRKAIKDVKFRDYIIPAGWKVLPVFSAVHLDPSLHADALHFDPSRWQNKEDQTCKKFTPFGGGSRCCPGFELAKVEVAFFLHHLVLNYRWDVEEGEETVAYPYVEFARQLKMNVHRL